MVCKVCDEVGTQKDLFCKKCGFPFREAQSAYYTSLEQKRVQLYKRRHQLFEEQKNRLQARQSKRTKLNTQIADYERDLKAIRDKILLKKKFRDQYIAESSESEDIQMELDIYNRYLEHKNALMKPYHPSTHDARRISYRHNSTGRQIKFISTKELEEPKIMLVLGQKKLNKITQDADYFLILDKLLSRKKLNEWSCQIPNPFNLKGDFYAFFNSMHAENTQQIPVEGKEFIIRF